MIPLELPVNFQNQIKTCSYSFRFQEINQYVWWDGKDLKQLSSKIFVKIQHAVFWQVFFQPFASILPILTLIISLEHPLPVLTSELRLWQRYQFWFSNYVWKVRSFICIDLKLNFDSFKFQKENSVRKCYCAQFVIDLMAMF